MYQTTVSRFFLLYTETTPIYHGPTSSHKMINDKTFPLHCIPDKEAHLSWYLRIRNLSGWARQGNFWTKKLVRPHGENALSRYLPCQLINKITTCDHQRQRLKKNILHHLLLPLEKPPSEPGVLAAPCPHLFNPISMNPTHQGVSLNVVLDLQRKIQSTVLSWVSPIYQYRWIQQQFCLG